MNAVQEHLRARIKAGESQESIAEASGLSRQTISEVVRGVRAPSADVAKRLGFELHVTYRRHARTK